MCVDPNICTKKSIDAATLTEPPKTVRDENLYSTLHLIYNIPITLYPAFYVCFACFPKGDNAYRNKGKHDISDHYFPFVDYFDLCVGDLTQYGAVSVIIYDAFLRLIFRSAPFATKFYC